MSFPLFLFPRGVWCWRLGPWRTGPLANDKHGQTDKTVITVLGDARVGVTAKGEVGVGERGERRRMQGEREGKRARERRRAERRRDAGG